MPCPGFIWCHGCICWSKICCEIISCFCYKQHICCNQFHPCKENKNAFQYFHFLFDCHRNHTNRTVVLQVLEFKKGRLQNLYWKRDGCAKCKGNSNFVCLSNQDCAIRTSSCKNQGGSVDCSIGIQLAFSGTDKHLSVLNSWYEVQNLRQYSLYGLYSNLKDSLTSQFNSFF